MKLQKLLSKQTKEHVVVFRAHVLKSLYELKIYNHIPHSYEYI